MKKLVLLGIIASLLTLASCSSHGEHHHNDHGNSTELPLTVSVEITPKNPEISEEVIFRAIVLKDDEKINGLDSIKFEIWKDGQQEDEHQMLKASSVSKGIYEAKTTFAEEGKYHVIYHINDNTGFHHMDKIVFHVGLTENNELHNSHSHDDGHGENNLIIHNMEISPKQNEKAMIMSHVSMNGTALEGGYVKFEIINEDTGEVEFVPASEKKAGEYVATYRFKSKGVYSINTHVEQKEFDIHDHKKWSVIVN
ncbi:hypothetical protein CIB95_06795 [Lottiidibacillus patelloidae]|uniref:YtkA-like domain-containing protein n=1 Tax=Lottiidibacillus patelloidae TaxID=2670334 RepID=A0A263BTY0_9BACI|nr:FixH family protein [Lottiidibacillus patelloidae]OZM57170.1 hypothetical protein CIB95_06795 [Lottiidibacillus patelloidae]